MRRHLRDEPADLQAARLLVVDPLARPGRSSRARRRSRGTMPIGWASYWKPSMNFLMFSCSIVCSVISRTHASSCAGGRQLAEEDQVRRLEVGALLGQLLDRIAAVEQDALVAVDVGDAAPARGGVLERRVVRHQPEVVGAGLDLPQVHRADRAVLDRQLVLLAGAVVGDRERVGHRGPRVLDRVRQLSEPSGSSSASSVSGGAGSIGAPAIR